MISTLFISIHALFLLALSVNVIRNRMKHKIPIFDGEIKELKYAIRAQANFTEYSPIFLLLLICAELNRNPTLLLMSLAVIFTAGRLAHAYSLLIIEIHNIRAPLNFRVTGMALSLGSILVLAITNILQILN